LTFDGNISDFRIDHVFFGWHCSFSGATRQTYEHEQFELIGFEMIRQQGRHLNFQFHFLEQLREKICKLESRSSELEQTFFVFLTCHSWFS